MQFERFHLLSHTLDTAFWPENWISGENCTVLEGIEVEQLFSLETALHIHKKGICNYEDWFSQLSEFVPPSL